MSKITFFLLVAVGVGGGLGTFLIDTHYPPVQWNPLAVKDGWGARWISRTLTDQADDAYHGGAKHDVKFSPKTKMGMVVNELVENRGEAGRGGRQKSDEAAQESYSRAVRNWLKFARDVDPSNFNAFFIYYSWLIEGFSTVEVGVDSENEEVDFDQKLNVQNSGAIVPNRQDQDLREAEVAAGMFLKKAKLQNSLDCSNATVALWMKYELELKNFPERKNREGLAEVLRKMKSLRSLGEYLGVGKANSYDREQGQQYANALIHNIEELLGP